MASLTVENYIKAIYSLTTAGAAQTASTGQVAKVLGISPGSVTAMFQTLTDNGLVEYQVYEGVRLTDSGRRLALQILRRHRLIELFLVKTLDMAWDEVHEEAENLEHAVSDALIDRIDQYLGLPEKDPHGDPIPRSDGSLPEIQMVPLATLNAPSRFRLERVTDQSPEFLRYLSNAGIRIGSEAEILENHPSAGALVIRTGEKNLTLGSNLAEALFVHPL